MRNAVIATVLALSYLVGTSAAEDAPIVDGAPPSGQKSASRVHLAVLDGQFEESEGFGFILSVKGWEAKGTIAITMVGPKGESVVVAPQESPIQLDETGLADIFVPYDLEGLSPGTWILAANSTKEIHTIRVRIPVVKLTSKRPRNGA